MPVRYILLSNSWCYIKCYNGTLNLYIIAISQSTKFLLISCIPCIEHNRSSVDMEHMRMDLNTQGGYILLKFTSQMTFQEGSFSSTTITNQYKFELNLEFSLGRHLSVTWLWSLHPHGLCGGGVRRDLFQRAPKTTSSWTLPATALNIAFLTEQLPEQYRTWCLNVTESTYNAGDTGDTGWIPGVGRSPGGGHGNPLQYTCLRKSHGEEPGVL